MAKANASRQDAMRMWRWSPYCEATRRRLRTIPRAAGTRPRRLAARQSCLTNHERVRTRFGSEAGRILELVVPVESHILDDAVAHHDDAGILGGEALVVGVGRHVDVVA